MNDSLRLSAAGANLIKEFESCLRPIGGGRFTAYLDPVGIPTIGWGHTNHHGRQFRMGDIWTQRECDDEFASDMLRFEKAVKSQVKVPLSQNQFDALVSFTYNCGEGNLARSTLLRKVNARNFDGAAKEFAKWNRGGGRVLNGLTRRRASEALLFQGIPDANYDGRPDKVRPPKTAAAEVINPPAHRPDPPKTPAGPATQTAAGAVIAAGAGGVAAHQAGLPWWQIVAIVAGILMVAIAGFLWWKGRQS